MRRLLPATLLVSAGAIAYELLLMRALSIVQWHHFAYMIISLALLGYGASGTLIAIFRARLQARFEAAFAASALLFSITMVWCFALGQRVPFNALEVVWNSRQFLYLSILYLVFFVPFFFAATCIGLAFTCRHSQISRIYFFDLAGAGIGAIIMIAALFALFPQNALLALATLPLVASAIMCHRTRARKPLFAVQLGWLALLFLGLPQQYLDLRVSEYKGLAQALQVVDSQVVAVTSSPLGLITVIDSPTIPLRHAPGLSFGTQHIPPEQLGVFTDGDSLSVITRTDDNLESLQYLGDVTAALPFALLDRPNVLVLGAGGANDVLLALFHGARAVDAVELDPQVSDLVKTTYADFAGRVYDDPRVRLHTKEARGFVAQSDTHYDLVHIGLLDSFGASGAGVQSLNESYIYTVEAIRDYLNVTAPGGIVAITRWLKLPPRDSLKLIATAAEALVATGSADPAQQLALIRSWNTTTLLIKNGLLTGGDVAAIRQFSEPRSFDTAWFPGIEQSQVNRYNILDEPYFFDGARALLSDQAAEFADRYKFHIEPATDSKPYYFHFFKWRTLPEIMAVRKFGGAALIEWGYLILVATLVQALLAGLLLILLPLSRVRRSWPAGTAPRTGTYFLLLGFAFLFIEMAFIQKFILFLSHPLYSVAVVLSSFLVFAGIGSAASTTLARKVGADERSAIRLAAWCILAFALSYVLVLPWVFERLIGYPDPVRIAVSVALIAPLAMCMGMPFPLGLKRVAQAAPDFIPWAWGINGFASVVSAVLATLLAIQFGFNVVVLLALVMYLASVQLAPR